jgi:hypothetical protein
MSPPSAGRAPRIAERLCRLGEGQVGEIAELHQLRRRRILLGELVQGFVQDQQNFSCISLTLDASARGRVDALTVALMQANVVTRIASHDSDFDRVPGITRYAPV